MTRRKNRKRLARERAAKTGESYITALRHVRAHSQEIDVPTTTDQDQQPTESDVRCSFCRKRRQNVVRLIAGPEGVYICDECTVLCYELLGADGAENVRERRAAVQLETEPVPAETDAAVRAFLQPKIDQLVQAAGGASETATSISTSGRTQRTLKHGNRREMAGGLKG